MLINLFNTVPHVTGFLNLLKVFSLKKQKFVKLNQGRMKMIDDTCAWYMRFADKFNKKTFAANCKSLLHFLIWLNFLAQIYQGIAICGFWHLWMLHSKTWMGIPLKVSFSFFIIKDFFFFKLFWGFWGSCRRWSAKCQIQTQS